MHTWTNLTSLILLIFLRRICLILALYYKAMLNVLLKYNVCSSEALTMGYTGIHSMPVIGDHFQFPALLAEGNSQGTPSQCPELNVYLRAVSEVLSPLCFHKAYRGRRGKYNKHPHQRLRSCLLCTCVGMKNHEVSAVIRIREPQIHQHNLNVSSRKQTVRQLNLSHHSQLLAHYLIQSRCSVSID